MNCPQCQSKMEERNLRHTQAGDVVCNDHVCLNCGYVKEGERGKEQKMEDYGKELIRLP